ncbi:MAG TPA: hypothetical protein VMU71_09730 [Terracidiphilus sp.]|nr:hypothetical protein [Terracidiphilus sp.]
MQSSQTVDPSESFGPPNGSGAAALLSAGIGACALAILAIGADRVAGFGRMMTFYKPTGPLSGVTTLAIVVWLLVWSVLELRWRQRNVRMNRVTIAAVVLLMIGLLLMFPPLADAL